MKHRLQAASRPGGKALLSLVALALLAACSTGQMAGSAIVPDDAAATPGQAGTGARVVGILAFDEPNNLSDGAPNSVALAAQLAATTLSGNPITAMVRPVPEGGVGGVISEFEAAGATIVIGSDSERDAATVAKALAPAGTPTISLTSFSDLAIQLYGAGFVPNEEAVALVDEAARRGYTSIAVVAAPGSPSQNFTKGVLSLAGTAGISARVIDGSTDSQFQAGMQAMANAGVQISAIVFATGPARAAAMMQTLAEDDRFKSVGIVGNSGWALAGKLPAALKGAWYTSLAGNGFSDFVEKFRKAHGQTPTLNAALMYDLVVMAAALPQAVAEEPYHPEVLTNPQGFKGFTGPFRFGPTGMASARTYSIATVK